MNQSDEPWAIYIGLLVGVLALFAAATWIPYPMPDYPLLDDALRWIAGALIATGGAVVTRDISRLRPVFWVVVFGCVLASLILIAISTRTT